MAKFIFIENNIYIHMSLYNDKSLLYLTKPFGEIYLKKSVYTAFNSSSKQKIVFFQEIIFPVFHSTWCQSTASSIKQ